jgi:hypothetical protein
MTGWCGTSLWWEPRVHAVPTRSLLLIESESPQSLQMGAKAVFAALPDARLQVL